MAVHRLILLLWLLELALFPILVVLDLGFSYGFQSNYYARFVYIAIVLLAVFFHLASNKRFVVTALSVAFLVVAAVGSVKGVLQGSLNSAFLSHIFYVFMPIIMMSYGWHFFSAYQRSPRLRRQFKVVMLSSLYAGIAAVGVFVFAYISGLSSYNAIGLWNFVFSGPYLAFLPMGRAYFLLALLGTVLAAKRGILLVFVVYVLLMFLLLKAKGAVRFLLVLTLLFFVLIFIYSSLQFDAASRLEETAELLAEGDLDGASAGRWIEALSAIEHLLTRADHVLLGAGFGAQFLPWPDRPEYSDYYSHYTHFGIISYVWIGGVLFPIAVYCLLVGLATRLLIKARKGIIGQDYLFFVFWIWGILAVSMLGAVLMNNSWLWFIIGCCLHLDKVTARASRISAQTVPVG